MKYRYYIENQLGNCLDITDIELFKEFCIGQEEIVEHLQSQLNYVKDGHPKHKLQPVLVGVSTEKFNTLLQYLDKEAKGFKKMYFVNRNMIPIRLMPKGNDLIRIINSEILENE